MQCVNCKNEINVGGNICPYCHTQPFVYGSAPYSGASGTNTEPIDLSGLFAPFVALSKWCNTPSIKENETTYTNRTDCIGRKWWKCSKCGEDGNRRGATECANGSHGCHRKFVRAAD